MPGRTVSRRRAVGIIGGGIALAPAIAGALRSRSATSSPIDTSAADSGERGALLEPIRVGSKLRGWTVASISPLQHGAVTVALHNEGERRFYLEILARDASPIAPSPPMQTSRFAVYVRNGGDGWAPTVEEQGLTAMALGAVIEANEGALLGDSAGGFLTHAERVAKHGDLLFGPGSSKSGSIKA